MSHHVIPLPTAGPTATSPEADYLAGVAGIAKTFQDALASALSTALDDHRILMASVLARRISAPMVDVVSSPVGVPPMTPTDRVTPPSITNLGRRTARELVLDALADATEPMSFADVKLSVVAAGGSEMGAQKVRTDLLRKGAILNRRGLYTITETGQEMRATYG